MYFVLRCYRMIKRFFTKTGFVHNWSFVNFISFLYYSRIKAVPFDQSLSGRLAKAGIIE